MSGLDCVANIGPRERQKRLLVGVVALGAGVALAAMLFAGGAPRMWRLTLVLPLWVAALGLAQARGRT